MTQVPFKPNETPLTAEELLMLVVQHEPVFCPTSERLHSFRLDSSSRDFDDLQYHIYDNPCSHCSTHAPPSRLIPPNRRQVEKDCVNGADAARDDFNGQLITIGEDSQTLYERLLGRAAVVAKDLRNETPFDLLHRVIDDAYSRICREAFHPESTWEAYLTVKIGFKRADILSRRIDEYKDNLKDGDLWTIVSRFGRTTSSNPSDEYFHFLRRESQYLGLFKALKGSVTNWTTSGLPGSPERAWGVLKKLVIEILLRETNNTTRVPLALIARRLNQTDRDVRKASNEAFGEFYRILRADPDLTDTEFQSIVDPSKIT